MSSTSEINIIPQEEKHIRTVSLKRKITNRKITLYHDQPRHVEAMLVILHKFGYVLDKSIMSSGKTYCFMEIFKLLKLKHIIYIGTLSMLDDIKPLFEEHGIPTDYLISFQKLRSMKGSQPRHGLLSRHEADDENNVRFKVTHKLLQLVKEGVLLVVDEIQYVRNECLQCSALSEIERVIIDKQGKSKVMELSGLPGGKEEYYINMMRRFRIIKQEKLSVYHKDTGICELLGAQEIVDFCMNQDEKLTTKILDNKPFHHDNIVEVCFLLYENIVQNHISDEMPLPPTDYSVDCKNGYYKLDPADSKYLDIAITTLHRASGYNKKTGEIGGKKANWGLVGPSLRLIEMAKINTFISNAVKDLERDPNLKVCIALNYKISIILICKALEKYNPLMLWGKIVGKKRKAIKDKFNERNNECRVLVTNIKVVNCAIALDDRGGHPRIVYVSPSYYFLECHQFSYRFNRGTVTASNTKLRFVYGLISTLERSILCALDRHTSICKRVSKKQVECGVKFPGEYEDEYYEGGSTHPYYNIGYLTRIFPNAENDSAANNVEPNLDVISNNDDGTSYIKNSVQYIDDNNSTDTDEDEELERKKRPARPPPIILSMPEPDVYIKKKKCR